LDAIGSVSDRSDQGTGCEVQGRMGEVASGLHFAFDDFALGQVESEERTALDDGPFAAI
jgi:hypothetical protein